MRRAVLLTALAFLSGGLLYWLMARENGFILIAVGDHVVQFSLWMAILLAVLALLSWRWLSRISTYLLRRARGLPGRASAPRAVRFRARTVRGLTEFFEGRWAQAVRTLGNARRSDIAHIDYLAAATAAMELNDGAMARAFLAKAEQTSNASPIARLLIQARMHIVAHERESALSCLTTILADSPGHSHALRLAAELYRKTADWTALEGLLPALRSDKFYDKADLSALEGEVYAALLRNFPADDLHSHAPLLAQLDAFWRRVPKTARRDPLVVAARVGLLEKHGQIARAEKELRTYLGQYWDSTLVLLYGRLVGANPEHQLVVAEAWNRQWPESPEVLLTLGRLSVANRLWGKARDHLEHSLRLAPRAESYAELANVFAELGEPDKSCHCYRLGLEQSLRNPPKPPSESAGTHQNLPLAHGNHG